MVSRGLRAPKRRRTLRGRSLKELGLNGVRACRKCGCTDDDCRGCVERTGSPCHWVERDLCSACVRQ